jgi:hypothetical protein
MSKDKERILTERTIRPPEPPRNPAPPPPPKK